MTEQHSEPFQAQATRSFGDYVQGAWYTIDPNDGQLMSLLGAGYFDTKGNPLLAPTGFDYRAGEVVTAGNPGIRGTMAKQETVNPEDGYTPNYDNVEVPEKMTGAQRATTADTEQENEVQSDGQVGTEQGGDSQRRSGSRTATRKSSGTRDS